jgi:hypothetical protein
VDHRSGAEASFEARPAFPLLTEGKSEKRFHSDPPARIDTFGFSIPIFGRDMSGGNVYTSNFGGQSVSDEGELLEDREVTNCRQKLPGGGFVGFSTAHDVAWIEASAKRCGGQNVEALSVTYCKEQMREAMREAQTFVDVGPGTVFDDAKVLRLDAVRDFDEVSAMTELLNGLAAVPRRKLLKVRRWQDAMSNHAESLRVGPGAWAANAYDKHAETKGEAAPGRLRTEFRMRHEQLTNVRARKEGYVMRQVRDVTDEKVQALTRSMFGHVAFDREVVGKAGMAEKVQGCEWLKPQERAQLWCYLTMPGYVASMSAPTARKYRDFAAQLGVTMAAAEEEMAEAFVRLDFDKGTEVRRVA